MDMTRGAWLLALFSLAAATGEAAIDNKAGVIDTDAGLLCVVSGALKGGARQAQVDTERAFDLMSAIAAHRAGPDVAKGAQPKLAKMSARTKQEAVAQSHRAKNALASLERQRHARQHSRGPSRQAQQNKPHCQRTSQEKWTNGPGSQALSFPRQRTASRASPRTQTNTPVRSP
ncbi:hypothetical protein ERJ75_001094600 [Trypanosoma vivax]|nr:hypothetical protein ERJ75_001094600 [Trypanosoma vivax]